ncbi:MAG: phage major capsid protein [Planctomycetota bacterium]|jgi:hypothetical protein
MADEVLAGTGGAGTWVVAEALSRYIIPAAYGNRAVLGTARIDTPDGAVIKRYTKYPVLADAPLTEVEEVANSAFDPTEANVQTARYGLATEISDLAAMTSIISVAELGTQMGNAMGAGIETRLAALFAAFTATPLGTTATALALADFLAGMLYIEANDLLDRGEICFVGAPKAVGDLRAAIQAETGTAFGSDAFGSESLNKIGMEWSLWGVRVKSSTKVATANTGADYVSAMYPAGQLGPLVYQVQRDPRAVPVRGQAGERKSATSVVGTAFYGAGNIDPVAGQEFISAV